MSDDYQGQLHRLLRPNWGSINQFAQELYSIFAKKPEPGSAMSAASPEAKRRLAAEQGDESEIDPQTGERTARAKQKAIEKERATNPILKMAADNRLEIVQAAKKIAADPRDESAWNEYKLAQAKSESIGRLEQEDLTNFQKINPDLPAPQWNYPETEEAYQEEANANRGSSGPSWRMPTPQADAGSLSPNLGLLVEAPSSPGGPSLPAHVQADIPAHSAPDAQPDFQAKSGKEIPAGEPAAGDGPVSWKGPPPQGGYYDLRIPVPDADSPRLPIAGTAGVSCWIGKTEGGSHGTAQVVLYPDGPQGQPGDQVDVVIPMLNDDEEIPPGIWISPIFQGNKGTPDKPDLYYYCQLPVWLP
jgi:hypothetical protein